MWLMARRIQGRAMWGEGQPTRGDSFSGRKLQVGGWGPWNVQRSQVRAKVGGPSRAHVPRSCLTSRVVGSVWSHSCSARAQSVVTVSRLSATPGKKGFTSCSCVPDRVPVIRADNGIFVPVTSHAHSAPTFSLATPPSLGNQVN